ncbi:MAG TPA: hypothetical protein VMV90_14330 [Rectinemataceae bacterium]|nr:hypothetical protein [Rectinemataceae bacterium]
MNVRFCESCRSLVLAEFRFCPYCGAPMSRGPGLDEALSLPLARIEASRAGQARFAELAERLDRLEADMDLIISQLDAEIGPAAKK